jgi:hypothetical protein
MRDLKQSKRQIIGIRDQRGKAVTEENCCDWSKSFTKSVTAIVTLTVDGYAKGPFQFNLILTEPSESSPPRCELVSRPISRFDRLFNLARGVVEGP